MNRFSSQRNGAPYGTQTGAMAIGADARIRRAGRSADRRRQIARVGDRSHALASRAGAVGAIEAERAGLDFRKTQLAIGTRESAAEQPIAPCRSLFVTDDARP